MKWATIIGLCFFNILFISGQYIDLPLQEDPCIIKGEMAYQVVDLQKDGNALVAYNEDKLMNPASLMKLAVAGASLRILGPDYTFETKFIYTGEQVNDILEGDIVVVPSGDPTFCSDRLDARSFVEIASELSDRLLARGISCVHGGVVIYTGDFDNQHIPDGWEYMDLGNYYASGAYPLNYSENTYELVFNQTGEGQRPEIRRTEPEIPQAITNLVRSEGTRDNAYIYFEPDGSIYVKGEIPPGKETFTIKGSLPNPPMQFAERLDKYLNDRGIYTYYYPRLENDAKGTGSDLLTVESPPLKSIVRELLTESQNLYTESLLKTLGLNNEGMASYDTGIEALIAFWKDNEVELDRVKDGSGLSPTNRLTARSVCKIVSYIFRMGWTDYLPLNGVEGTVKHLLNEKPYLGKFRLKSGSMGGVLNYAGALKTANGRDLAFVLMMNDLDCSQYEARRLAEEFLAHIYNY